MPKQRRSRLDESTNDERKQRRADGKYKSFYNHDLKESESAFFEKVFDDWWNSKTPEEKEAIRIYTGSTYHEINQYLRDGKYLSGENKYAEEIIKNATSGLKGFTLNENLLLYRKSGTDLFDDIGYFPHLGYTATKTDMQNWVNELNNYKGMRVRDKGFTSSSTSRSVWSGKVWMEIQAPKGTRGAYVDTISKNKGEREFLLSRGTRFKIISARVEKGPDGSYHPIVRLQIVRKRIGKKGED